MLTMSTGGHRPSVASPDTRLGGFSADLSDADLTARVPLVIEATVQTQQTLALANDPYLPADALSDPETAALVESGYQETKWSLSVNVWLKGTSAALVCAVRGGDGSGYAVEGAQGPGGGVNPLTGGHYQFWLEPARLFNGQEHYVLVRAQPLT